ncbi:hypothetical protein ACHRV5_03215 [Flavobacterium sp. FlaQc-52]|jgi:hypothetical protein|uniref:hypothetical protein n=1 Tax=Flavobacterium sp. FlaQc-52 TaxID=3374185 RepID=UPI00375752A7
MKNQEKLKQAFEKYSDSLIQIQERRLLWKNETKEKIYEALKTIENEFKPHFHIQKIEHIENYQTINISFNSQNSGMIETVKDFQTGKITSFKPYLKHSGYLAFSQSYNGKINIFMKFPYIEEWILEMNVEVFDTIEPKLVTEELISEFVIKFLNKQSQWEGADRTPVGFKME